MSIQPFRLDSVSADDYAALQLDACRAEFHRPLVKVAENIFFTGAEGARAPLSQKFERKITFESVGPSQSELVANDGHIFQATPHAKTRIRNSTTRSSLTPMGIKLRK